MNKQVELRLRRWLAEPKGQLQLIGGTLIVAVILACVLVTQRAWFEDHVREKYQPVLSDTTELAAELEQGRLTPGALSERGAHLAPALYQLWMQSTGAREYPKLPRALSDAFPNETNLLLERTFAAGTREQQQRAAELIASSRHPALAPALELAIERAHEMRNVALAITLKQIELTVPVASGREQKMLLPSSTRSASVAPSNP